MDDESKIVRLKDFGASNAESSSSGRLKRTRGPSNGIHVPSCLVDGCRSDLGKCRDYHRRHKVCETHSKTPKVTICGQEQRFCQQCSRFHSLGEFDDEKRSCRKRLDGHNRRRRKPQPESLTINSGRFLSTYQGTRFSPFHSPQMFPSSAISSALAMASNSETNTSLYNAQSQSFPRSLSHAYTSGKEISFLQSLPSCTTISLSEASHMASNTGLNNCGSQKTFSEWLHRDNNIESNCALSLLSSSTQTGSSTSKAHHNNHHAVQPNSSSFSEAAHRAQSLTPGGLRYHGVLGMLGEQVVSSSALLTNDGSENAINFHCQDVFRIRPDGSSSSGDGSENAINFHCQDVFRIRPDGSSSGGPHHSSHYRGNRVPP